MKAFAITAMIAIIISVSILIWVFTALTGNLLSGSAVSLALLGWLLIILRYGRIPNE